MIESAGRVHLQDDQCGLVLLGFADAACDQFLDDRADRTLDLDQVRLAGLVGSGRRADRQRRQDCKQA